MTEDTRNVTDEFKGVAHEKIVEALDARGVELEIAIENLERDFNMGTIVRNANAFGVRNVHVIGRRQWNKRGAMKTDAYLYLNYYQTPEEFFVAMSARGRKVIAVDIVDGSQPLDAVKLPQNAVLVFGAEGPGLSDEILDRAQYVTNIEQFGSTRSVNVGVASGIAIYAWLQQHVLGK